MSSAGALSQLILAIAAGAVAASALFPICRWIHSFRRAGANRLSKLPAVPSSSRGEA